MEMISAMSTTSISSNSTSSRSMMRNPFNSRPRIFLPMFARERDRPLMPKPDSPRSEPLKESWMLLVQRAPAVSDQFDQASGTGGGPSAPGSVFPVVMHGFLFIPTMYISLETLLDAGGRIGRTTSNEEFVRSTSPG